MRNKLILGTILILSLVLTVAVTAVAPAIANSSSTNSRTEYSTEGEVVLQLPSGGGALASRPTNLKILALDIDRRSGGYDKMMILLWVSAINTYTPIALISDQAPTAFDKAQWNNSAVYLEVNGVVIRNNLKTVADKELDVWQEFKCTSYGCGQYGWSNPGEETLHANLTVAVQLDFTGLPPVFGSSFAVPAMDLQFVGIASGIPFEDKSVLPTGATIYDKGNGVPAWVMAFVPTWGFAGIGNQYFDGIISNQLVTTITLPS